MSVPLSERNAVAAVRLALIPFARVFCPRGRAGSVQEALANAGGARRAMGSALGVMLLALVLLVGFAVTPSRAATVFSDNFDSTFFGWTATGTPDWYTGTPRTGSHSIQFRGSLWGGADEAIDRSISTAGYYGIQVSFSIGANSLDNSGEYIIAEWYNGSTWTEITRVRGGDAWNDNALHAFTTTLGAGAENNANFRLRFSLYASATNDYAYVDDVVVSGTTSYPLNLFGSNGTVTADGTVYTLPASPTFASGTVVALHATPNTGYHFVNWTGDATGTGDTAVTMSGARNVTANFAPDAFTLSLAGTNGSVTVNGTNHALPWSQTVYYNDSITLSAVPDTGYQFTSWSGGLTGTANPASITITGDTSITAGFAINTYALSITGTNGGVVVDGVTQSLPYSGTFTHGTVVTLAAAPNAHCHFTGWSGDLTGTTTPTSITMDGVKNVTAGYALDQYALSLTGSNGSISVNGTPHTLPWSGNFDWGSSLTLAAVPNTGYHFTAWSGDLTGSVTPTSLTIDGAKSVGASFALNTYTLSVTGEHGAITVNGGAQTLPYSGVFAHGASVTLAAVADTDYHFDSWSGDVTGTTSPITFPMDGGKNVTVTFLSNPDVLFADDFNAAFSGWTTTGSPDWYTGTPRNGSHSIRFLGASGSGIDEAIDHAIPTTGYTAIQVSFSIGANSLDSTSEYIVAQWYDGSVWTEVTRVRGGDAWNDNALHTFTATLPAGANDKSGFRLRFALYAGSNTDYAYVDDVVVSGTPLPYDLNLSGSNGTVLVNSVSHALPWSGTFRYATTVNLEAVPDAGYDFTGWSGSLAGTTNPTALLMNGDKNVTAAFALHMWTLSLSGSHGSVTVNGTTHSLPWSGPITPGASVTLVAVPDSGYHFTDWSGDVTDTASTVTFTMDSDKSITASFARTTHTLTLTGSHGTVWVNFVQRSLPWSGTFYEGDWVILYAQPATGYHFVNWTGDVYGTSSTITITIVDGDEVIVANFAPNAYTLSLTGTNGSVSVNGTNHALPWSQTVYYDDSITLTAVPNTGYHFSGWTGGLTSMTNPITFTVTGNTTIRAGFTINAYTLNITGTHGSVVVNAAAQPLPYTHTFNYGASLSLAAVPDPHYHFTGWSGDLSGSASPVSITIDGDKSVTVGYAIDQHTLSLSGSHGAVSVNGTSHSLPYSEDFDYGASVALGAAPGTGYHFTEWSGDLSGSTTPTSITMDGDKSVAAGYALNTYTLSLTGSNGSVVVDGVTQSLPYSGSFDHGDSVALAASPDTGYHFTGWSGDLTGSTTPTSITMDGNKSVTAGYAINTYTLSISGSNGSVVVNGVTQSLPYSGSFDHGDSVTLAAAPDTGYHFTEWSGDLTGSTTPTSISMDGPKSVIAGFAPNIYSLNVTGTHGSVVVNGVTESLPYFGTYSYGESVSLASAPEVHYHFTSWSGDLSGSANPATIVIDGEKHVTAGYAIDRHALVLSGTHGTVAVNGVSHSLPYSADFDWGASVNLAATPDTGYHFTGWSGDLSGTTTPTSITMDGAKSVTVGYAINTYTLSITGTRGSITVNGGAQSLPYSGTFTHGEGVVLAAVAEAEYHFTRWSGDLTGTTTPTSITMDGDKSVSVGFAPNWFTLAITGSHGRVLVNGAAQSLPYSSIVEHDTSVTLAAAPDTGYHFTGWSGDLTGTTTPTSVMMDADKSITVGYAINVYTLGLSGDHGTVRVNGESHTLPWSGNYNHGTTVTLLAVADTDYSFAEWGGDLSGTTNPTTLLMDRDWAVSASFTPGPYTVEIWGLHAEVVVDGTRHPLPWTGVFAAGTTVRVTAIPDAGYQFLRWFGDLTGSVNPSDLVPGSSLRIGIAVGDESDVAYRFDLDDESELADWTGWETTPGTGWAYGKPVAGGGQAGIGADPEAAHSGSMVIGYVIGGNYQAGIGTDSGPATAYLTTPPLSFAGRTGVTLRFWRWLSVGDGSIDAAAIEVNDGSGWEPVWANPAVTPPAGTFDATWTQMEYALPQADDKSEVWVRWAMGPTDVTPGMEYGGWSLDDIEFVTDPATWQAGVAALPATMQWGDVAAISVAATNSGTAIWERSCALWSVDEYLSPTDRWGLTALPLTSSVWPGDSTVFAGQIAAPRLTTMAYPAPAGPRDAAATVGLTCDWRVYSDRLHLLGGAPSQGRIVTGHFPDVQPGTAGEWARFWVEELAGAVPVVVRGFWDGCYHPEVLIDRGSLAVYVARCVDLPLDPPTGTRFSDVPVDHWAAAEIEACAAHGMLNGYPDGSYRPDELVDRGGMAKLMANGRKVLDPSFDIPTITDPEQFPFPDLEVWNGFISYIAALKNAGIVEGYPDGTYQSHNTVTRDQLAGYLWRTFMRDMARVIVLGGPGITGVNPAVAEYIGYSDAPNDLPGGKRYAYVVLDAMRLHDQTDPVVVAFELQAADTGVPAFAETVTLDAEAIAAAVAAAMATGNPYLPVSVAIPDTLGIGAYNLVVTIGDDVVYQSHQFVYTVM